MTTTSRRRSGVAHQPAPSGSDRHEPMSRRHHGRPHHHAPGAPTAAARHRGEPEPGGHRPGTRRARRPGAPTGASTDAGRADRSDRRPTTPRRSTPTPGTAHRRTGPSRRRRAAPRADPDAWRRPATARRRTESRPPTVHDRTALRQATAPSPAAQPHGTARRRRPAGQPRSQRPVHGAAAPALHQEPPVRADARAAPPLRDQRRRRRRDARSGSIRAGSTSASRRAKGTLLGDLLRAGEIGYELSLDPRTPIVIGVYPMRPIPRG